MQFHGRPVHEKAVLAVLALLSLLKFKIPNNLFVCYFFLTDGQISFCTIKAELDAFYFVETYLCLLGIIVYKKS